MGLCHSRPRSGAAAQAAATSIPTTEEHRQKNFAQTSPQQASAALSEPRSSPALSTPASPAAASQSKQKSTCKIFHYTPSSHSQPTARC